jgi:hypothetical protein
MMAQPGIAKGSEHRAPDATTDLLIRHLKSRIGRVSSRDNIMYTCGFPSGKEQPVIAYASFAWHVMRANERLRPEGKKIVSDKFERYGILK